MVNERFDPLYSAVNTPVCFCGLFLSMCFLLRINVVLCV